MDEDGPPPPMKDRLPAQRNPNAADKFWLDHQAVHENQVEPAGQCHRVERHNDAFPKMKDELNRKRSIIKPKATNKKENKYSANRTSVYDPKCKQCVKERKEKEARKKRISNSRSTCVKKRSKVTKNNKTLNREKILRIKDYHNSPLGKRDLYVRQNHLMFNMTTSNDSDLLSKLVEDNNDQNRDETRTNSHISIIYRCHKSGHVNGSSKSLHIHSSRKSVDVNDTTISVDVNGSTKSVDVNGSSKGVDVNSSTTSYIIYKIESDMTSSGYPNSSLISETSYDSYRTLDDTPMGDVSKSDVSCVEQPDNN